MNSDIYLLGRGMSLNKISSEILQEKDKDIIFINNFEKIFNVNPFMIDFFKNNNVYHIVSRDAGLSNLTKKRYEELNIKKIILNIFQSETSTSNMLNLINSFKLKNTEMLFLDNILKSYEKPGGGFPTTGLLGLIYSIVMLNKKNINIYGIDFYESDYYFNEKSKQNSIKKGASMKSYMYNTVEKFSNVNFNLNTYGNITKEFKNLNVS